MAKMITKNKLHNLRRKYMMDHTPTDRILEEDFDREYSTFVTSAGGDITQYRIYGNTPEKFMCCIK